MSKGWATIVYGRTYHLDFRLITIPQDFTTAETNWATQHIVATTQQARNLKGSPRWSLFKNHHHCVVGVTCMVKDLIGDPIKDDQDRPLYIFVGYVTQLNENQAIEHFPAYSDRLDNFKILYQAIEPVWLVKNYEPASRAPSLSQYYPINFYNCESSSAHRELPLLNSPAQDPDQIYLWQNTLNRNRLLWQASAQAANPIATCLNIQGKVLNNSPFLNQSNTEAVKEFQIVDRIAPIQQPIAKPPEANAAAVNTSLSQKISHRAKEDLDLTLQQAAKMANELRPRFANASQELLNNFGDWNQSHSTEAEQIEASAHDPEFGFKTKKSSERKQDWF